GKEEDARRRRGRGWEYMGVLSSPPLQVVDAASKSLHSGGWVRLGMLRPRAGGRVVKAVGEPGGVAARMAAGLCSASRDARFEGTVVEWLVGNPWLQSGPLMLPACSRLHSAELRVELLEVQRGMQRRRGQAARAAGWAGIMPRPFDASESSG